MKTTTGTVDEGRQLMDLVAQHQENTELTPRAVVGDSKYGSTANFIGLAKCGVRSHMADLRRKQVNPRAEGIYPAGDFAYQAESDRYRCPAGKHLYRHHFVESRGYHEYRTRHGECEACELRSLCTRAQMGRSLKRYEDQELLDRARKQSAGPAARKDRIKRKWMMEGSFAMAAVKHGLKRSRWRGLWKQEIQNLLIAAIQNLKTFIRRKGSAYFGVNLKSDPCFLRMAAIWVMLQQFFEDLLYLFEHPELTRKRAY